MRIAILTANTEIYREQEEDKAGKVIREIVEAAGHQVVFAKALPLDKKVLSTIMQRMADGQMADLILTTGGAGLAQGDCTPEATLEGSRSSHPRNATMRPMTSELWIASISRDRKSVV